MKENVSVFFLNTVYKRLQFNEWNELTRAGNSNLLQCIEMNAILHGALVN